VASADSEVAESLGLALVGHAQVQRVTTAEAVNALVVSQALEGVVLDMELLGRETIPLAERFLTCHPTGRVVILEASSGPRPTVDLSLSDHSVEMLARPIDFETLRECFLPQPVGAASRS
jgi:hypothetical protein